MALIKHGTDKEIERGSIGLCMLPYSEGTEQKLYRLVPGWNFIEDEIWNNAKIHVTDKLKQGKITELSNGKKYQKLTDIDESEAQSIVQNCFNLDSLNYFLEHERREIIRVSLSDQIDRINKGY
jgi:hypothetical protein